MKVRFRNYGDYSSDNYGAHTLCFTDAQGNEFYYSYKTLIAFETRNTGLVIQKNVWGPTTGKHLNWIDGGREEDRVDSESFSKKYKEAFGE